MNTFIHFDSVKILSWYKNNLVYYVTGKVYQIFGINQAEFGFQTRALGVKISCI